MAPMWRKPWPRAACQRPRAGNAARGLSQRGQLVANTASTLAPAAGAGAGLRIGAPEVARLSFAVWHGLARQASQAQRAARAHYLDPAGTRPAPGRGQWLWASARHSVRCGAGWWCARARSRALT